MPLLLPLHSSSPLLAASPSSPHSPHPTTLHPRGKLGNWDHCPLMSAILDSNSGRRRRGDSQFFAPRAIPAAPINQVFPAHHKVTRYPRTVS